jgi:shikimate kinase
MKVYIAGPKGSGKSSVSEELAKELKISRYDSDELIIAEHYKATGETLTFREIFNLYGENYFRNLEVQICQQCRKIDEGIIALGGGTLLNERCQSFLDDGTLYIYLTGSDDFLWQRIIKDGLPVFLQGPDGFEKYAQRNSDLALFMKTRKNIPVYVDEKSISEVVSEIREKIDSNE